MTHRSKLWIVTAVAALGFGAVEYAHSQYYGPTYDFNPEPYVQPVPWGAYQPQDHRSWPPYQTRQNWNWRVDQYSGYRGWRGYSPYYNPYVRRMY